MTSSPTTTGATPAPVYRCTSCGWTAPRCVGGLLDAADHAAQPGHAVEPISNDQLVPTGAGDRLGQLDAGGGEGSVVHEITIATLACSGHVNPTSEVLTAVDGGTVSP